MAAPKTRFLRGDAYGFHLAALKAADLIEQVHLRAATIHHLCIEALDCAEWDDLVISTATHIEHWQAKDQKDPIAIDTVSSAISAAYKLHKSAIATKIQRQYHFGIRHLVSATREKSKAALELTHLQELCKDARQPSIDPAIFTTSRTRSYDDWWPIITSAIGESDPSKLLGFVRQFYVDELGDDRTLQRTGERCLRSHFADPVDMFERLVSFFDKYPDGRIHVTYKVLADEVLAGRLPALGAPSWIDLRLNPAGTRWELRGTVGSKALVSSAWKCSRPTELHLSSTPVMNDEISVQLARLALHRSPLVTAVSERHQEWSLRIEDYCCGTMGHAQHAGIPSIHAGTAPTTPQEPMEQLEVAALLDHLTSTMDAVLWASLTDSVRLALRTLNLHPLLRSAMQSAWETWHSNLDADASMRSDFLARMLATRGEARRRHFRVATRLGLLAIPSLTNGLVMALALNAAFSAGGLPVLPSTREPTSNLAIGSFFSHVLAVALAHDERSAAVTSLAHHPSHCLSDESRTLILSLVHEEASQLLEFWRQDERKYSQADSSSTSYDKSGPEFPIITASASYIRSLEDGCNALREHLASVLKLIDDENYTSLARAVMEATSHA
jgi:hypothetical protein